MQKQCRLSGLVVLVIAALACAFNGGNGTAANPYQIATRQHLEAVNNNLAAHYILLNDIDLAGVTYTQAVIGTTQFTGSFNGKGFVVKNLTITAASAEYLGLFGYCNSGASISNVAVEDCNISGYRYVGGLVGYIGSNSNTKITNCYTTGNINCSYSNAGGLVGRKEGGSQGFITNCYSTANVSGSLSIGGLVGGHLSSGIITNCYATGSVSGASGAIGGLVGNNGNAGEGVILNSYATGSVSGTDNVGGLVGSNAGVVKNCYSTGFVSGSSSIGGLIGSGVFGIAINSFWDIDTSGQTQLGDGLGIGKTTAQMKQRATYIGWNFNKLWTIEEGISYPAIQDLSAYSQPKEIFLTDLAGLGTANDPYIITNADELNAVRQNLSAHYRLANDIDLSACVVWNGGLGWKPIDGAFKGVFDGAGFAIKNMAIDVLYQYLGLFGKTDFGGVISNLGIENCHITGYRYAGGLAGDNYYGTITNCYVTGTITTSSDSLHANAGGLVGRNYCGKITNCYANADVRGLKDNIGGLVGSNYSALILNSYAIGTLTGSGSARSVGGLVGYSSSGTIGNCFAAGAVNGSNWVGGLVGYSSSYDTIRNCYATGDVNGSIDVGGLIGSSLFALVENCYAVGNVSGNSTVGGLVGYGNIGASQAIINSYWDTETTGQSTSIGGLGKTTVEMKQRATYIGWNFIFWTLDEGNSYPSFRDLSVYSLPQDINLSELGGSGTSADPYIITSADQMNAVRQDLTAHYLLGDDIDLAASIVWNGGLGWNPIGTSTADFTGVFDGNGFAIENLTIYSRSTDYIGLFRSIASGGIVKNLTMKSCNISGYNFTGGLAGMNSGSITNCCVIGNINHGQSNVGGLVGWNSGPIIGCFFSGYVNAYGSKIGGVVGQNNGTIANCYAMGYKCNKAAGLAGENWSIITNCYAVVKNYYYGYTSSDYNNAGFATLNNGTITSCFWDTEETGLPSSAGGIGRTTAQMQTQSTFINVGWDFVNEELNGLKQVWYMPTDDYPRLYWQAAKGDVNYDGDVNESDLYVIAAQWLGEAAENQRLTGDIDDSSKVDYLDFSNFADVVFNSN